MAAQLLLTGLGPTAQHLQTDVPSYLGRIYSYGCRFGIWMGSWVWNLLHRLVLTLDYERKVVTFRREPMSAQVPSAPLQILKRQSPEGLEILEPIVECSISGFGPFPCFIDTGTSAPVFVQAEIWQTLGLEDQKQARLEVKLGEVRAKRNPRYKSQC